jgi:hypothetical protein
VRRVIGVSGILFSEALAAEGTVVFAKACETRPRRRRVEAGGQLLSVRQKPQLVEEVNPDFDRT